MGLSKQTSASPVWPDTLNSAHDISSLSFVELNCASVWQFAIVGNISQGCGFDSR